MVHHSIHIILALAQTDTTWTTLIVLASPVPLDGGITLRANTKLIGEKSPINTPLTISNPIITNSSSAFNGGNGVVIEGREVKIENIYFKDTWAAAIRYDNAEKLFVTDVFITGHNQAKRCKHEETTPCSLTIESDDMPAIYTQNNNTDIAVIDRTIVSDDNSGSLFLNISNNQNAQLDAAGCEFVFAQYVKKNKKSKKIKKNRNAKKK